MTTTPVRTQEQPAREKKVGHKRYKKQRQSTRSRHKLLSQQGSRPRRSHKGSEPCRDRGGVPGASPIPSMRTPATVPATDPWATQTYLPPGIYLEEELENIYGPDKAYWPAEVFAHSGKTSRVEGGGWSGCIWVLLFICHLRSSESSANLDR